MRFLLLGLKQGNLKMLGITLSLLLVVATMAQEAGWAKDESVMMLSIQSDAASTNAKDVQARVMIAAPPALVWEMMTDYPAMKNILPGYEQSTLVSSAGSTKLLDIAMKVAVFLPTYRYRVQVKENKPQYRLSLHRISGDFKSLVANYQLSSQNGGTRTMLTYNLKIDPGFQLPGSSAIIRGNAEKSLRALERHAEQQARKSLIGQR